MQLVTSRQLPAKGALLHIHASAHGAPGTAAAAHAAACPGTKLVCALGPSSHDVDTLEKMLNAGMVGARIDLTWGGLDFHRESLKALNVRAQAVGHSRGCRRDMSVQH